MGITVTIATHRGTETQTLEDARPETLERVASWLASGWRVDVSMQLNAGPILEHGERSGRFGVWHHEGKAEPALKLDTEYSYTAARTLLTLAGLK